MKFRFKLLWSLLAGLPVAAGAGASGSAIITEIIVDPTDGVIGIEGAWADTQHCARYDIAIIRMSDTNYKDELAAALTAFASGRTANFQYSGCINSPWGEEPLVAWMNIN